MIRVLDFSFKNDNRKCMSMDFLLVDLNKEVHWPIFITVTVYAWKSMKYAGVILPYVCFSLISFLEWNSFGKRNFCNYYICQARLKRVPRANICTNWINSELYWPSSGNLSTVDKHRGPVSSILNDHLSVVLRKSQKGPKLSGRS